MKRIIYFTLLLLLVSFALAGKDVFQNTHFTLNATSTISPGSRGIAAFLSDINDTVQDNAVVMHVSATWFQKFDKIIVDVFVEKKKSGLSGLNCTLSLKNSDFTEILTDEIMAEHTIAGEPHYTYNTTNISSISSIESGKFFGHAKCAELPNNKVKAIAEADFEVHEINVNIANLTLSINNTEVINQIISAKLALAALLDRQFDFSQEEIFLVTDAFNSMGNLLEAVESGKISEPAAAARMSEIEKALYGSLNGAYKQAKATFTPKSGSLRNLISTVVATPRKIYDWSKVKAKSALYIITLLLLCANVLIAYQKVKKKKWESELDEF